MNSSTCPLNQHHPRIGPLRRSLRVLSALLVAACTGPARAEAPAPDWAAEAVWYQIFPERFRNGDPTNDPTRETLEWPVAPPAKWRVSSWTGDWYARDEWERELGSSFFQDGVLDRRYGGDLQGVLDQLDYLADLGVNALYFNPLFASHSLHKYDGDTFHHIDPHFGPDPRGDAALIAREVGGDPKTWRWTAADRLFLRLLAEAHRRGFRVILDGVFNHTGRDFFAFQDLRKNQARSRYRDWFVVQSFDDPQTRRIEFDYQGWWGYKTLPVFAATPDSQDIAAGPKAYIFAATRRWMDPDGDGDPADGIDGWRLDVAPERPAKFWADWNAHVRKLNPHAYTSCEIWTDPARLIADGGFSASMNYFGFAIPVKGFLVDARITATQFARLLDARRGALPGPAAGMMQNLMDSHDTDRLASMIVNAPQAKYSDPEKIDYNTNGISGPPAAYQIRRPNDRERAIQRLVVLFQMTYPGAPMIYYGDEAGMWGGNDPDDRLPMAWADLKFAPQAIDPRGQPRTADDVNFDPAVFQSYRAAIALRREHLALRRGGFQMLGTFDDQRTLAFLRGSGAEARLVLLNRSEQAQSIALKLPAGIAADFARARTLFTSNGETAAVAVAASAEALTVQVPALTGVVLAP